MSNSPIHLTILRRGDVHIVDLAEVQAIIPRSETRVEGAFLNEIGDEIKRITNLVGPEFRRAVINDIDAARNPRVVRDLKNLGSLIFSHLLPQGARDRLRSSESSNLYLRLDDQLVHIPWELAFDGQHFLGMKFRVGRQIITHHKIPQPARERAASDVLKVLIVSDPSETLSNVTRECEQLCEILDGIPSLEVRLVGGRGVRRIPLLAALRESDIVHFAGHSQFDEKNPENSGWLLHDGLLSASEISKLDQTPLLVFSNSCHAGATNNWQGEYLFEGQAFGLGSAFLLAGVRNYVGTFCVVHDEESRFLAVEFYRCVARGKSIGEALLDARVATAEEMGLDRLTWASYMLYGDPSFAPITPRNQGDAFTSASTTTKVEDSVVDCGDLGNDFERAKGDRIRPHVNERNLAWLSAALFATILTGFAFMLWRSPTRVPLEPVVSKPSLAANPSVGPHAEIPIRSMPRASNLQPAIPKDPVGTPSTQATQPAHEYEKNKNRVDVTTPKMEPLSSAPPSVTQQQISEPAPQRPSQDLTDIRVDLERLQIMPDQGDVVAFLKILNKTQRDLAIHLAFNTDATFVADNRGSLYGYKSISGIGLGVQQWTYIPVSAVHTMSIRFHRSSARPQRDFLYSLSAEVVLAPREDIDRLGRGRMIETARTVNISLHGVRPD